MAFWKIAPGRKAEHWEECLNGTDYTPNGTPQPYICIGWDEVGDARQYATYPDLEQVFRNRFTNKDGQLITTPVSLWPFVHDIQIGDWILASRKLNIAIGLGVVTGNYVPPSALGNTRTWRENLRTVDWVWTGEHQLNNRLGIRTVHRLQEKHIRDLSDKALAAVYKRLTGNLSIPEDLPGTIIQLILRTKIMSIQNDHLTDYEHLPWSSSLIEQTRAMLEQDWSVFLPMENVHFKHFNGRFGQMSLQNLMTGLFVITDKKTGIEYTYNTADELIAAGWVID